MDGSQESSDGLNRDPQQDPGSCDLMVVMLGLFADASESETALAMCARTVAVGVTVTLLLRSG